MFCKFIINVFCLFRIFVSFNSSMNSRVCSENVLLVRLGDLPGVLEIHHFRKFFFILFYFPLVEPEVWQCRQLTVGGVGTSSVINRTFKSFVWIPRNLRRLSILPGTKRFFLTRASKQCLNYSYNIIHNLAR